MSQGGYREGAQTIRGPACRCGAELEISHPLSGYGGPYDHD